MKRRLDPELAAVARRAELQQRADMIAKITRLTSRVPPKVMNGDVILARAWKQDALKASDLTKIERATSARLRSALLLLEQYE